MGIDRWRTRPTGRSPDTQYRPYYLHSARAGQHASRRRHTVGRAAGRRAAGRLPVQPVAPGPDALAARSSCPGGNVSGPRDQRAVEARDDVLVYSTPVLDRPVEVTGPIELRLFVASSARDTDFTGKLVDVTRTGGR